MIDIPGFHEITAREYHADPLPTPSLSSGIAHLLVNECPEHAAYVHPKLGGRDKTATPAMDEGDVAHQLFLGKGAGYEVIDPTKFRNKDGSQAKNFQNSDARAAKDAALAAGLTVVTPPDFARIQAAVNQWKKKLVEFGLDYVFDLDVGSTEQVIVWEDAGPIDREPGGILWCRAMMDRFFDAESPSAPSMQSACEIWDLKTCPSAHPEKVDRKILNEGLALRSEFYKRGVEILRPELAGRITFGFIFAEINPPFTITPVVLDPQWQTIGAHQAEKAISLWGECLATKNFPGYVTELYVAHPPHRALMDDITGNRCS